MKATKKRPTEPILPIKTSACGYQEKIDAAISNASIMNTTCFDRFFVILEHLPAHGSREEVEIVFFNHLDVFDGQLARTS